MDKVLEEVYIIMNLSEVFENGYYTNESKVSKRVEDLNSTTNSERFWYKTLFKVDTNCEGVKTLKKQRWRFTTGKQYKCSYCGQRLDKRYLTKKEMKPSYIYCSSTCNMYDVGMSWSDFV